MPNIDQAIELMRSRLGRNAPGGVPPAYQQQPPTMTDELSSPPMNVPLPGPRGMRQDLGGVTSQGGQAGIIGRGGNFQPLGAAAMGRMQPSMPLPPTTTLPPFSGPSGGIYANIDAGNPNGGGINTGTPVVNPVSRDLYGGGLTSLDPATGVPRRGVGLQLDMGHGLGIGVAGPGDNVGGMPPPMPALSPAESAYTDIAVARPQAVGIGGVGGTAGGAPKPGAPAPPPLGAAGVPLSKPSLTPPSMPGVDNKLRAARRPGGTAGGAMQRRKEVNRRMSGVLTRYGGLK